MNADSCFHIGCSHIICEDYSLSGVKTDGSGAFIVVSDGCSASQDVDFGSRLLCLSTRELLSKLDKDYFKKRSDPLAYADFGTQIIQRANVIPPLFPLLADGALDATLLVGWVEGDTLRVYMYGDGLFLHKTQDGIHAIHVSFDNNAPSYLSYWLDTKRQDGYLKLGGRKEIHTCIIRDGREVTSNKIDVDPFEPVVIDKKVAPGHVISVCSDGVDSFRRADYTPIPWQELVEEYIGYKSFEGAFAKRRFAAFRRKCQKEGVTHHDDISIATMVI